MPGGPAEGACVDVSHSCLCDDTDDSVAGGDCFAYLGELLEKATYVVFQDMHGFLWEKAFAQQATLEWGTVVTSNWRVRAATGA